jgi:hypothetical protein
VLAELGYRTIGALDDNAAIKQRDVRAAGTASERRPGLQGTVVIVWIDSKRRFAKMPGLLVILTAGLSAATGPAAMPQGFK